ncbi:MAG: hypothetical protein LBD35_03870 [Prevotellaceae bacterium]|jgi:hypothetical protein|nr:hypothetical protein [Prevotellaceae bacterium]
MKQTGIKNLTATTVYLLATALCSHPVAGQRDIVSPNNDTAYSYNIFDKLSESSAGKGKVTLGGDNLKALVNETKTVKKPAIKGCRIRVFRDNSQTARQKAESIKAAIEKSYPALPVYISHQSPDFYVEAGDFRTPDDAEKMKRRLVFLYPAATLVNVSINFPPL